MTSAVAFAKALADGTRLRVVVALLKNELCVCELCDALEVTQSTLSTQLNLLKEAGILQTRKEGKWIYYRVAGASKPATAQFVAAFGDIEKDARIKKDAKRISQRLALREGGCCNVGFDELGKSSKRKEVILSKK